MGFGNFLKKVAGLPADYNCPDCKEPFKGCAYEYQVRKEGSPDNYGVVQVEYTVWVTCPKCGKQTKLSHFVKVRPGENPDSKMRDWAIQTFGH